MSSEQLASIDLGMTNYEAQRFHSKSVGEPFILNRYEGLGITLGTNVDFGLSVATPSTDKASHRVLAINDGSWVTISGSLIKLIGHTAAVNTWTTLFTISLDNTSPNYCSALALLRPHPGAVRFATVNGAGTSGDDGIGASAEWMGGHAISFVTTGTIGDGAATPLMGICRILATGADTYDVQALFTAAQTNPGASGTRPCFGIHLRYPAAPVSRANNLA